MKNLLFLALVLSVASIANAALVGDLISTTDPGTVTASLNITDTSGIGDWYYVITIKGTGIPGTFAIGLGAPADSFDAGSMADGGADTGLYGNGQILSGMSYNSVYPTGTWINATFTGAAPGDIITAYSSVDGAQFDVIGKPVTITPEPMTLGLLGLGCLYLRRRK